jgi:hypothetical protein
MALKASLVATDWKARYRARWGNRPPFAGPNWFYISEFEDSIRKCCVCGSSHFFEPNSIGYWSADVFRCAHCASRAKAPSADQGCYIGRAFLKYGQVHNEWRATCICCRTRFFNEAPPRLRKRTDKERSRDTIGARYRHGSGAKAKDSSLRDFCDRCDGSMRPAKYPSEFGYELPERWPKTPPKRKKLPKEKPAVRNRPQQREPLPPAPELTEEQKRLRNKVMTRRDYLSLLKEVDADLAVKHKKQRERAEKEAAEALAPPSTSKKSSRFTLPASGRRQKRAS